MPTNQTLLSPPELSYLHTSLSLNPPLRPDVRTPTTFRPLVAETSLLPSCNGSARLCFSDGSEAIVGVKAEVEKSPIIVTGDGGWTGLDESKDDRENGGGDRGDGGHREGRAEWVEVTVDIPGQRDDEPVVVFLGQMIHEALVADGYLPQRLNINSKWHWRLYIDVSPPTSHPSLSILAFPSLLQFMIHNT